MNQIKIKVVIDFGNPPVFWLLCILFCIILFLIQEDLLYMKINNALHHMSIRRGIEVLRTNNFNLGTLRRRPSLERSTQFSSSTMNGSALKTDSRERDVSLWTNHRVMEWLRMIDLSEYAVNLRGSGVHGALMVSL